MRRGRQGPSSASKTRPQPKTFKSVSYIISYAPEGTSSACKICHKGFHPGKLR